MIRDTMHADFAACPVSFFVKENDHLGFVDLFWGYSALRRVFLCPRRQRNQNAAETALVSDFPLTLWLMDRVSVDSTNQILTSAPRESSNYTASADLRPSVTRLVNSCR